MAQPAGCDRGWF